MRRARPAGSRRALRYGAGTSALVLLVCAVIAGLSARTLHTVGPLVSTATARAIGEVVHSTGHTVEVRWSPSGAQPSGAQPSGAQPSGAQPSGAQRTDTVELAAEAPAVGTRTEVAYNPQRPGTVFLPGSAELAAVDRATSGLAFGGLIATIVLSTLGWQLISRHRLYRRPGQPVPVRRVRVQSGLLTRSWLELDNGQQQRTPEQQTPEQWIPVHFDPVLVTLPAPVTVLLHGKSRPGKSRSGKPRSGKPRPGRPADRHRMLGRLVGVEVNGVWLHPSGPVRRTEPRGRRIDSPTVPDADAADRAARCGWRRQLRADAALLVPAPIVGLLWTFLDDGDVLTWACATALTAALALWWAALRGSDPT